MSKAVEFEKLTADIFYILRNNPNYETVEHNVTLPGKDGRRQIDVLLKGKIGPIEILTIVECKDYNKIVNVTVIDELHSKMEDVNAHKAVLVARKGFSKQAIRKAKRVGITLCTVHKAKSEKWEIPIELPVVIEQITPELIPQFKLQINQIQTFNNDALSKINDMDILDEFKNMWNNDSFKILIKNKNEEYEWQPENITSPYFIRNIDEKKIFLKDVKFRYKIIKSYYFGYINELENSKALQFIIEGKTNLIYKTAELLDYEKTFQKFNTPKQLPNIEIFALRYMAIPKIGFKDAKKIYVNKISS